MESTAPAGDRSGTVVGVTVLMIVITTLAITLRFISRWSSAKLKGWWDDYLALAAFPFLIVLDALILYWVHLGFGKPIREATASPGRIMVVLFVVDLIYNTGLTLLKYSVLAFYARCFKASTPFNIALWVGVALATAWWITFTFLAIFTCIPVSKAWEEKEPGHCVPTVRTFYGTTLTNVTIDAYILILPLPLLWNLQTALKRKAALTAVFLLGYCVIIISICRLVSSVRIGKIHDPTWQLVNPGIFLETEPAVGMLSICLPAMYDLIKRMQTNMPSLLSRSGVSTKRSQRSDAVKLHDQSDSSMGVSKAASDTPYS